MDIFYGKVVSFWGFALRPPQGFCPWTPLGDFRLRDPLNFAPSGNNSWLRHCNSYLDIEASSFNLRILSRGLIQECRDCSDKQRLTDLESSRSDICNFWATVCKTVRPVLSDRYPVLSCLYYDTDVLWPNSWVYQDATWYGGRPWSSFHNGKGNNTSPRTYAVYGRASVYKARPMSICCGQTVG